MFFLSCYLPTAWANDIVVEAVYSPLVIILNELRSYPRAIVFGADFNARVGGLQPGDDVTFFFFLRSFFLAEGLFWMTVLLGSLQAAPFLYRRLRMCMKGWAKSKPQLLRGGLGDG